MPSPTRSITTRDVRRHVDEHVFAPKGAQRVGIELEWITRAPSRDLLPSPSELRMLLGPTLPGSSRLTFEPGGQLELSGPAHATAAAATAAMAADVAAARTALAARGVELVGIGLDPTGLRNRVVDEPRYEAMESYFDARWPMGRTMMRNTAAVQVNVDLGGFGTVDLRWQRAHDLAPVLAAAFANSPFDASGAPTGWRSTRLAVWRGLDARRTRPAARPGTSAASAWTDYALEAPVMLVRSDEHHCAVPARPLPFARWIHEGHELGWPTLDDFAYHLTTLFPPVRPRGWLELRTVDALPDEWWPVAVAVSAALLDDPEAADTAAREAPALRHRVADAARLACSDPVIGSVVDRCFVAALPALTRAGVHADTIAAAEDYYERYVARRRCPADDLFPFPDPARLPAAT
ncbi:MAG: glutamate-cysteine ligase family protein [Acidimicrobiia bacterium]